MGFSVLGLALSLAVFAPNLLLLWFPPRPAMEHVAVPKVVEVLERSGQALCVTVPVITVGDRPLWWWAIPAAILIVAYWALWGRYLLSGRRLSSLFAPVVGVPVPMALLPVACSSPVPRGSRTLGSRLRRQYSLPGTSRAR